MEGTICRLVHLGVSCVPSCLPVSGLYLRLFLCVCLLPAAAHLLRAEASHELGEPPALGDHRFVRVAGVVHAAQTHACMCRS